MISEDTVEQQALKWTHGMGRDYLPDSALTLDRPGSAGGPAGRWVGRGRTVRQPAATTRGQIRHPRHSPLSNISKVALGRVLNTQTI